MFYRWSDLGAPTVPGDVYVKGFAIVQVVEADIEKVKHKTDDPLLRMIDVTGIDGKRTFRIADMIDQ